jgi:hypothetical protein
MKPETMESPRIPLGERVVSAFIAALAAALTLCAYPLVMSFVANASEPYLLYGFVFSKIGAGILVLATIVGFAVGSERLADIFSFFWGTHPMWEEAWLQNLIAGVLICAIVLMVTHALYLAYGRP